MNTVADLSVVMATYNHAQYLPRALTALVTQSVVPSEIIVVNDASTDETPAILEAYARDYPMVKVFTNSENRRTNESIRIGLSHAHGKYIFCGAADDYVLPGFVEKLVGALEASPQAGVCSAYFSMVNGVTGEISPNASGWCTAPRYFPPDEFEKLIGHSSIPGHASIVKRSSFDAAGAFLPDLEWHSDWFMSLVVAFREGICHVPETLSLFTEMPQSYSNDGVRSARQSVVLNAIFDRLASPEYSDVVGAFQRSGVLSVFGPAVLRAVAGRTDAWSQATLGLINGLKPEDYEGLLDDPDRRVRELARFFLGPFRHEIKERRLRELDERQNLERAASAAQHECTELRALKLAHEESLSQSMVRLAALETELNERDARLRNVESELVEREVRLGNLEKELVRRTARLRETEAVAAELAERIRWMESSRFWKCRTVVRGWKDATLRTFRKAA